MRYSWDCAKATSNLAKHGVAFEAVEGFDWVTAVVAATLNHSGGEPRLLALGAIGDRLHVLVYSVETRWVRIISLRKASKREVRFYASES